VIARDLRELKGNPAYSLDTVLAEARADDEAVQPLRPSPRETVRIAPAHRWRIAAVTLAACAMLSLIPRLARNPNPPPQVTAAPGTAALHLKTGHGEQLTRRLADNSLLHLNTDSAVTVQYDSAERLVTLSAGQASFEVAHAPDRPFRVLAGSTQVVAVGTQFDVRLERDTTVVTVIEGRVAVRPSPMSEERGTTSDDTRRQRFVELGADRQATLIPGEWPPIVNVVDAQRVTAWLHRQISFDHEPLERVAAEYNRYAKKPIEITTPALRTLLISGAFATDDPEEFISFLRSLKGVKVEVTATKIRVSGG